MKCFILLTVVFTGTIFTKPCLATGYIELTDCDIIISQQVPFNFFNTVPDRIRTTDMVDLSFSVNNEVVSQYRYRLEVPDFKNSQVNLKLLGWATWNNDTLTEIVIPKIEQEGLYKLVIEYIGIGTTEIREVEKLFEIFNPVSTMGEGTSIKSVAKTINVPINPKSKLPSPGNPLKPDYDKLLTHAVMSKNKEAVIEALTNGAGNNIKGIYGGNIFHIMNDTLGVEELVLLLKNKGFPINETDDNGNTPLHIAILSGERKYARALMNHGADLDFENKLELSPLHIASFLNEVELAKELLASGAEVNIIGNSGYTPLHIATLMNNIEVAKDLVCSGARTRMKTDQKLTPKAIAKIQRYDEMINLIVNKCSYTLPQSESNSILNTSILKRVKSNPQYDFDLLFDNEFSDKEKI